MLATSSSQCTHIATRLSSIATTITGQKTTGNETQSDLLTMGVKTLETITNKSLFAASCWSHLYLLIKDARSSEHKKNVAGSDVYITTANQIQLFAFVGLNHGNYNECMQWNIWNSLTYLL
jgi:hypothetical protein